MSTFTQEPKHPAASDGLQRPISGENLFAKPATHHIRPAVLLCGLFVLVYLVNFSVLRIVRDDWSNIRNFQNMLDQQGFFRTLYSLFTNLWIASMPPRIFGVSWVVQTLVGYLGRYSPLPYYAFILGLHLLGSCLVARLVARYLNSPWHGFMCGSIMLVAPTASNALFFLNNWFFVLPFQLAVIQTYWLFTPSLSRTWDMARITLVAAFGQLAGEQPIPMFYVSFALALALAIRRRDRRGIIRTSVPFCICLVVLVVYATCLSESTPQPSSLSKLQPQQLFEITKTYTESYTALMVKMLDVTSWIHGSFSIRPRFLTIAITAACGLILIWPSLRMSTAQFRTRPWHRLLVLAGLFAVYAVAGYVPCLYGAFTGERAGASTRYMYVTAIPLLLCAFAIFAAFLALLPAMLARVLVLVPVTCVIYLAFTMAYSLGEVWRVQKEADEKAWAAVDKIMTKDMRAIVTYNLVENQAQLAPHYLSDAVSDFQADWGVGVRQWVRFGKPFIIAKDAEETADKNKIRVLYYYGGGEDVPRDSVGYLTSRYTPRFAELSNWDVEGTTDFAAFAARKMTQSRGGP